jgi:DNA-binding transcriptional LysR family regulator
MEQYIGLEHALISPSGDDHGIVDHWLDQYDLSRNVVLLVPHFLSAPLIIAHTDLALTLPYRVAEHFVKMAPIKLLQTPIPFPCYQMSMIWHPLYEKDLAQQWLREQIYTVGQQITESTIPPQYLPKL